MNEDADVAETPPPHPRWCLGLPFAGVAPLEAPERDAVGRHRKALALRVVRYLGVMIVLPAASFTLGTFLPEEWQAPIAIGAVIGVFGGLVGAAAALLATLEGIGEARRLGRDLRGGEVLVFRGDAPAPHPEEERPDAAPPGGPAELRVLPTARTWLRPGQRGMRLIAVRIQHAAPPPAYAWRVALHDDLVPRRASPDLRFEQRRLTPSESREIVAYSRRLVLPGLGEIACAVFALAIFVSHVSEIARDPSALRGVRAIGEIGPVGLFVFVIALYVRRVRLARRLRVDLQAGRAVTAVRAETAESRPAETVREFLPVSGITWTFAGRPAAWRNAPPEGPSAVQT